MMNTIEGPAPLSPQPEQLTERVGTRPDPLDRSVLKGLHRWESEGGAVWTAQR